MDKVENEKNKIIVFPEFEALKEEVEKLRVELSMLILEKDELVFVECKSIEMAYMLVLGSWEYKAYELHCIVLRLKRKLELIQTKINRQEKINIFEIENTLDSEFEEYQKKLDEEINKINDALERSKGELLSDEEAKELKKLYRAVIKKLHPDLNPNITEAQLKLFYNAVAAYENGDLKTLRLISSMVSEEYLSDLADGGGDALYREKERLLQQIKEISERIQEIKSEYPYIMKDIVNDEERIEEEREDLEDTISELKEMRHLYEEKIEELLR